MIFFKKILYYINFLKLKLIRKFLNFPKNKEIKRGFIIIQLDGLSYNTFQLALEKGYLKNIKKYILKDKFSFKKLYSPLPSNTPYFQKTLFYGDEEPLPGFRWFNKNEKKYYTFLNPETATIVENQLKKENKKGILFNGVSYFNFFSGDAERNYLTMSKIFTTSLKNRISGLKLILIIFLNIFTIFRVTYWALKELINEIKDNLYFYFNDLYQKSSTFFPFVRIFNNVILSEYVTSGACIEIICGTPKIYITLNAYDELAHQRGATSRSALKILKLIDKSIFRIYQFAKYSKIRKYDFFILSDHGSTDSIPFFKLFKKSLKEILKKYNVEEHSEKYFKKNKNMSTYVLKKVTLFAQKGDIPKIFSKLQRKKFLGKNFENFQVREVNLISFGPVCHLYFNKFNTKLKLNEIIKNYAFILIELLSHKGVGWICIEGDNDSAVILEKNSFFTIKNGKILNGSPELIPVKDYDLKYLEKLIKQKNCGDIIVFSNFLNNRIINFEDQMSCHGGIGYNQNHAFIIYPKYREVKLKNTFSPIDLHTFFKKNYF